MKTKPLTLPELIAALVNDDEVTRAVITDTVTYSSTMGVNDQTARGTERHEIKITLVTAGDFAVGDVARLTVANGIVTDCQPNMNQPWWAVEAVRKALTP